MINKQYLVGKKLGNGSFGDVFEGTDRENGTKVAIKMEHKDSRYPILVFRDNRKWKFHQSVIKDVYFIEDGVDVIVY